MARKKHYNYYDDHFKTTAIGLADLEGVYATAIPLAEIQSVLAQWTGVFYDDQGSIIGD